MELIRKYNGTDAYLIIKSQELIYQLNIDIADFTALDSSMDASYITAINTKIGEVLNYGTDETRADVQSQLTQSEYDALKQCQLMYATMKHFAEKTFPANKNIQNEFGTNNYADARNNQAQMVVFMSTLHVVATKYKTQLIAEGCTQAQIDDILTRRDAFVAANSQQDAFINSRPVDTRERVEQLNELYDYINEICRVAQIVYDGNDAKQGFYVYLPGSTSGNSTIVTGNIPAGALANVLDHVFTAGVIIRVEILSNTVARVFMSDAPDTTNGNMKMINGNSGLDINVDDFGVDLTTNHFLNIENLAGSEVLSYKVIYE